MRGRKLAPRLDLLATIQGHYAGEALLALLRLGVLDALATPRKSRALARLAGVDHALLQPVLEFVRRTTEVVNRDRAGRYRLGQPSLAEIAFQLEKFIGAYGPSLRGLDATLRGARSSGAPDDRALARAFAAVAGIRPLEGEILRGMGVPRPAGSRLRTRIASPRSWTGRVLPRHRRRQQRRHVPNGAIPRPRGGIAAAHQDPAG